MERLILMSKRVSAKQAIGEIKDGMTLLIGGFLANGTPEYLIDTIIESGVSGLTVIANDTGITGRGISKLVAAGCVKKVIVSHIGTNPQTGELMNSGSLEVQLVPQGTLAEQIRAGGAGLGGILTPTGLGTEIALGKEILTVEGINYLLEKPIRGDVALIYGSVVDDSGNVLYMGTTKNFNPLMAMAAHRVIVEAQTIVPMGDIPPEQVATSGIFVDYIVEGRV